MKYEDYFSLFLSIEEELTKFLSVVDYSDKHKNIYSHKLVLLLLQTCPVIESYLVKVATSSYSAKQSKLWECDIKTKIWDKKNKSSALKVDENGNRCIGNFPKFVGVNIELFNIHEKDIVFYHSANFQNRDAGRHTTYRPFDSFKGMLTHNRPEYKDKYYPTGYTAPVWWTSYNKVKHDFGLAKKSHVNYRNVIEAITGLFCALVFCEPDLKTLAQEGFFKDGMVKTKFFEARVDDFNSKLLSDEVK
ncbi:hypothetical protein CGJ93_02365 [Vibrio parahaemolyticus]|uniref:hypothetical protein n=1 Tax=Vibrio TaxID=662 RepID=UPI001120C337|nr:MULTISPECIES: hypothetical protein [Vibrio]MDF4596083.1 hypothetical protein [Vibrio parahaemolyticus]MDG2634544.1 hypothetical protein [Vibrio parahaemolyticus]MDW1500177.1 hypothetical protein [Vibrio sp. YT-19(2023)]TOC06374.1 hypothetical protein CGJ93_02365 [Vibrio parahaemolyticus]TOK06202.1 hypothetical protein CGI26_13095 [Vibrio parahaemolyticus]